MIWRRGSSGRVLIDSAGAKDTAGWPNAHPHTAGSGVYLSDALLLLNIINNDALSAF
jgi:hypothetical protein